jgi:hypothetical protein
MNTLQRFSSAAMGALGLTLAVTLAFGPAGRQRHGYREKPAQRQSNQGQI